MAGTLTVRAVQDEPIDALSVMHLVYMLIEKEFVYVSP